MATHAAIAARDREAREKISKREAEIKSKQIELDKEMLPYNKMKAASETTLNIVKGAAALKGYSTPETERKEQQSMKKKFNRNAKRAGYQNLERNGLGGNHPEWYRKFVIPETVANLPTYTRAGLNENFKIGNHANNNTVAGILSLHYIPTLPNVGKVGDSAYLSPINVGLSRFMAELRKLNSRIGNYDPSDLGLYWYAAADYMTVIEKLRQAIKVYNTYHAENAYFAKAMLEAIGFNANMVFENIAELRVLCSKHIKIFNSSIAVPNQLTFFQRRLWMAKALIKDRRNAKSQYYVFSPDALGTLSEDEDKVVYGASSSGKLRASTLNSMILTLEQMRAALVDSVGIVTMVADIRAGVPASSMLQLEDLDPTALAEPTDEGYDLEQIHNLRTCFIEPGIADFNASIHAGIWTNLDIRATADGYLIQGSTNTNAAVRPTFTPVLSSNMVCGYAKEFYIKDFINVYHDDVTSDDILEATRLRHIETLTDSTGVQHPYINGTEIIGYGLIYYYDTTFALKVVKWGTMIPYSGALNDTQIATFYQYNSQFDWMPPVKSIITDDDGDIAYTLCEFDQYFPISEDNLKRLHEACGLSEFFIDGSEFSKFAAR